MAVEVTVVSIHAFSEVGLWEESVWGNRLCVEEGIVVGLVLRDGVRDTGKCVKCLMFIFSLKLIESYVKVV